MSGTIEPSVGGEFPTLTGATGWLNSEPLAPAQLRGRVVAVEFWTYTCINWIRSLPYVRAWAERYATDGLVTIGVHTPEFGFEHDVERVRAAAAAMRVGYPIALDNDYAVWDAFFNEAWPALYLIDSAGQIRYRQYGEGDYDRSEDTLRRLLGEAGDGDVGADRAVIEPLGVEAQADWDSLGSPETYLGFARSAGFASPTGMAFDESRAYSPADSLALNQWGLSGEWTVGREEARSDGPDARIAFRFEARDVNLVMGPSAGVASVPFRVLLDGHAPGASHGLDTDESGAGNASELRMYQLIRQSDPVRERTCEITFPERGAAAFVFTFG
jgi:thiol-disulfide isomerase/thioredoxin